MVATHEVGHALGLKHDTTHNKSVMQPEANLSSSAAMGRIARLAGWRLPSCDVKALATVWGSSLPPIKPVQNPTPGGWSWSVATWTL